MANKARSALAKLGLMRAEGQIPFVQGLQLSDCGPACLAMVLGFHGREEPLAAIAERLQPGRDGVSMRALAEGAAEYGLVGRVLSVPAAAWADLAPGTILHWKFSHYVVFERHLGDAVRIVDPSGGSQNVPLEEFKKAFTGIALELSPGESFVRGEGAGTGTKPQWSLLRIILRERRLLVRITLASVILQLFSLGIPALTTLVLDRVLPRGDLSMLWLVGAGGLSLFASLAFAEVVRLHLLANLRTVIDARVMLDFFEHLLALPYSFFLRHTDGDLLMRLNSNATIREVLTGSVLVSLLDGVSAVSFLLLLFFISPATGALMVLLTVILGVGLMVSHRKTSELNARYVEKRARTESFGVEVMRAVETVKAMGLETDTVNRWANHFVDSLNEDLRRSRQWVPTYALGEAIRNLASFAALLVGATLVLDGKLQIGELMALVTIAGVYMTNASAFAERVRGLSSIEHYLARVADVMETKREAAPERTQVIEVLGHASLRAVSFSHGRKAPNVVDTLSLELPAGSLTALVGPSGSGKSTLMKLLAGLYAPTAGEIVIDGVPLSSLDLQRYRRQIAVVSQETQLFAGSIRQNIALSLPDAPLPAVIAAASLACVHEDIIAMPLGYDTVLSDQGRSLSGGQRQRLALARALLRRPKILLLDEATSAIDAVTEEQIKKNLDSLKCTRVVVAHRLSTVRDAHRIVVMRDGKIVEQGTHAELLTAHGAYFALVRAQQR